MATLVIGTNFAAGTVAKASEVNGNFSNIVSWSTTLDVDNFATLTGELDFNVGTTKAVEITNTGTQPSIDVISNGNSTGLVITDIGTNSSLTVTKSGQLAAGKAIILITDAVAQVTATAAVLKMALSSSATIPAIDIAHGSDVTFKLTKTQANLVTGTSALDGLVINSSHLTIPSRTTVQKNALVAPLEGSIIYDSTAKQLQFRTNTTWQSAELVDNSVTLAKMADASVGTVELIDGSVTAAKLATGIGTSKFQSYSVPDFALTFNGAFSGYGVDLGSVLFTTTKANSIVQLNLTSYNQDAKVSISTNNSAVMLIQVAFNAAVVINSVRVFTTGAAALVSYKHIGCIVVPVAGAYTALVKLIFTGNAGGAHNISTVGLILEMVELA